ncbi:alanine:cation symporter family protein [Oceanobacillus luteolus]|uniref:alanine/glycine:cation symporter family protein n=1 Tax=Oceanobacillus luteolus TaxID=1274358 RepID=UPI00203AF3C3|nr:alanine/glycine:cation symporter family protein [Oceanobacillus luteolus]MCM3742412.1 alanine:cation symporter family protein [Oceanobacillus luteolus]
MSVIENIISVGNDLFWSYILIIVLVGLALYFTFKTGFVQFKNFKEMFRLLGDSTQSSDENQKGISSFQAFTISTATRVGTGNVAGVAVAISLGGPGAVFWMWVIALFGASLAFVESTLAQMYKVKDPGTNGFKGGPAYYMERAMGKRWMGVLFAILITFCFGFAFNSIQTNTIASAFNEAFGIEPLIIGSIITILTGFVIFGGVTRIAKVTQAVVPVMAILYVALALYVVVINYSEIPAVFGLIVSSAFGLEQAVGGGIGAAIMNGVKRGLFSNEAGMGSAPVAAATANVSHPVKQGFVQTLGVFVDTLLICSATAFIILFATDIPTDSAEGIQLTQLALSAHVGEWASIFIAIAILLFCFSSIIGNYYYGEANISFIKESKLAIFVFRIAVLAMVLFGSVASLEMVWNLGDLFMALMAIVNLIALAFIGKLVAPVLKDYLKQRKEGKDPVFYADNIEGFEDLECWQRDETSKKQGM